MNTKERKELVKYYQALIQNDKLMEIRRKKDEKLKAEYNRLSTDIKKLERALERLYDQQILLKNTIRERAAQ